MKYIYIVNQKGSGYLEFKSVETPYICELLESYMIKQMFPEIDFKNKKSFEVVTFCDLLDKRDQINFKKNLHKTLKVTCRKYGEYHIFGEKNISLLTDHSFFQKLIGDDFKTGSLFTDKNEDVYITFVLYDEN